MAGEIKIGQSDGPVARNDFQNEIGLKPEEKKPGISFKILILTIVLSLIFGIVGGAGTILIFTTKGKDYLKYFGISPDSSIPTTQTDRLILEESSKITDAVKKVSPSVVSIVATDQIQNYYGTTQNEQSAGSGFIITSDGLIMTNKHVVSSNTAKYKVFTSDSKSYDATVQSRDPFNDLAVVKINAKNLPVVNLGNIDDLQVGQHLIAIGNALGEFQNTVTVGVLSAKERTINASAVIGGATEKLEGLLQTDAAINPGNSGGPLVNLAGQVIGVNVAVAEGAENIGFAIPVTVVKSAMESIKRTGKIVRPSIGVRYVSLTPEISSANNLNVDYGALIYSRDGNSVIAGSPAAGAGLKQLDIITEVNGEKIDATHSLSRLIQQYQPGDEITLTYLRDSSSNKVKIKLGESS